MKLNCKHWTVKSLDYDCVILEVWKSMCPYIVILKVLQNKGSHLQRY